MYKVLWIDTETTGLNHWEHDIIQLSGMVEVDGKIKKTFNYKCQPINWGTIQDKALEVHGMDRETLATFDGPHITQGTFEGMLGQYVNKFDKSDKFTLAGYNIGFDLDFLKSWWKRCGAQYFGSYFEYKPLDVYPLACMAQDFYGWPVPNHKLATIADFMGIELKAHDAMSDITVTREIYLRIKAHLQPNWMN